VLLTYDEEGGYPHPDHVMCHNVSAVAFDAAADPDRYPGIGDPWQTSKLYYHMGFSKARLLAIHQAMLEAGLESPYSEWLEQWGESDERRDKGGRVTTRVRCDDYFAVRDDALRAHATQVDPEGFWFRIPMEIQRKIWPTEDYELARSFVETDLPEDDLFAGLRARA
jgi:mycothiol S-conjugate amidase